MAIIAHIMPRCLSQRMMAAGGSLVVSDGGGGREIMFKYTHKYDEFLHRT